MFLLYIPKWTNHEGIGGQVSIAHDECAWIIGRINSVWWKKKITLSVAFLHHILYSEIGVKPLTKCFSISLWVQFFCIRIKELKTWEEVATLSSLWAHTHRKNILASNISSSFYEIRDASSFLMASLKTWLGWSWGAWRKSSGITLHWSQFKNKRGRIYIESKRSLGHCKNICFLTSWKSYKDVKLQHRQVFGNIRKNLLCINVTFFEGFMIIGFSKKSLGQP